MYNIYLTYYYMRNIYGVYATLRFFRYLFGYTYYFFSDMYSFFEKEEKIKMIEDKKKSCYKEI